MAFLLFLLIHSILLSLICTYIPGVCNFSHLVLLAVSFVVINFYFLSFLVGSICKCVIYSSRNIYMAHSYCSFASLNWFRKLHVQHIFLINDTNFIVTTQFINKMLLACSFEQCVSLKIIEKLCKILREISTFWLFERFSFQLPSPSKLNNW